jgi:hypothetical protein
LNLIKRGENLSVKEMDMAFLDLFRKPKKPELPPKFSEMMKGMAIIMFPNGYKDIQDGGTTVKKLAHDKLSREEAKLLFTSVKSLLFISDDKSPERIKASIAMRTQGKLTETEILTIYRFISGDKGVPPYSGGDGSSFETAIVINHTLSSQGIHLEYLYLEQHFGKKGKDWEIKMRSTESRGNHDFDWFCIKFSDGSTLDVYFDITAFYSKF